VISVEGRDKAVVLAIYTFIRRVCGLPHNRQKLLALVNPYAGRTKQLTLTLEGRWAKSERDERYVREGRMAKLTGMGG
jgi:hypothetical protein